MSLCNITENKDNAKYGWFVMKWCYANEKWLINIFSKGF